MKGLSSALRALALTPSDQIILARVHRAIIYPFPVVPAQAGGRTKKNGLYGRIRQIAARFVAGDYAPLEIIDVAIKEGCTYESLKQSVWRVRRGYVNPPRPSRAKAKKERRS